MGAAIAGALRGDEQPQAAPRDATASSPTVRPGDDVAAILARVGDGSTVTFRPGSYELTETIVVDVSLELVGAGRGDTTISSTAAGLALAFVGPGDLLVRDLALRHAGDDAASVLLAIEGGVTLTSVEISGAVDRHRRGRGRPRSGLRVRGPGGLPAAHCAAASRGARHVEDISVTGNQGRRRSRLR